VLVLPYMDRGIAGSRMITGVGVDLWWLRLNLDCCPTSDATLSHVEREHAGRFRHRTDRQRYVASRLMLRSVLSRYCDSPSHELHLVSSGPARPLVEADVPLRYSLSRSGPYGLIAVSTRPVGADVEARIVETPTRELVNATCSPAERNVLKILPSGARREMFTTFWVRKEAVLKAAECGLGISPSQVAVGLGDRIARLEGDRYSVISLAAPSGYRAAVAALEPIGPLSLQHAIETEHSAIFRRSPWNASVHEAR
jgi:4'-phosphopantetheinyl transferase